MRFTLRAVGVLLATAAPVVRAQSVYPDVEYIQGRDGLPDKLKGQLAIGDSAIVFTSKDGREVISVPMAQVKDVTNSFQTDPGSFGRKLALGIFASRKSEYLYLNTESPERVEVLVFKTKKNMSPEMMARVRHNMKSPATGAASPNPSGSDPATPGEVARHDSGA